MGKILDINTIIPMQIPNLISKDGDNKVSKIIDTAQNICFSQSDSAKQPVLNYNEMALEFDGVNDSLKTAPFNIKLPFTIKQRFRIDDTAVSNQTLIGADGLGSPRGWVFYFIAPNEVMIFDGTLYYRSEIFPNLTQGVTCEVTFSVSEEGYSRAFFNGEFVVQSSASNFVDFDAFDHDIHLGQSSGTFNTRFLKGAYYGCEIIEGYYESGNNVSLMSNNLWYKRYKDDGNKKLFLTSRNLEGADINSASEITSIESEIPTNPLSTQNMVLVKDGFYMDGFLNHFTSSLLDRFTILKDWGIRDFYYGIWIKPQYKDNGFDYYANLNILAQLYVNANTLQFAVHSHNGGIVQNPIIYDKWQHIAFVTKNSMCYFHINGVLIKTISITNSIDVADAQLSYLGVQSSACGKGTVDDILFVKDDSIIDPTGYNINDPVFEMPMRKSTEVKEYEGRELVQQVVNNGSAKLYLNSKYTKDSDIDGTTGEITSIKDEFVSTFNGSAKITSNGFGAGSSTLNEYVGSLIAGISTGDFHLSAWMRAADNSTTQYCVIIGNNFYLYFTPQLGSKRIYANFHGSNYIVYDGYTPLEYYHVAMIRYSGSIYCFLNGVLKIIQSDSYDFPDGPYNMFVGDTDIENYDDILFTVGDSIIDPSGYIVNDKVFTPPRRSSAQPWLIRNKPNTINL